MSQLLLVLKLPALVDHFMVSTDFFFQCLTILVLIIVALQPESNNSRRRCLVDAFVGSVFSLSIDLRKALSSALSWILS